MFIQYTSKPRRCLLVPRVIQSECSKVPSSMLGRKRRSQPLVATSTAGQQTGNLSYVTECESRLYFLVNTRSEVSIIPPSKAEPKNRKDTFGLLVANNSPIMTYGTHSLTLNLGLRRTIRWVFMVANLLNLILGADILKSYGLIVDMRHRRLLDIRMQLSVEGIIVSSLSPSSTLLPKSRLTTSQQLWPIFPLLLRHVARIVQ